MPSVQVHPLKISTTDEGVHRLAMALKGKSKFKFIKEQLNVTLAINKIGNIDAALATIRGGLTFRL
jgi:hypothetical protein